MQLIKSPYMYSCRVWLLIIVLLCGLCLTPPARAQNTNWLEALRVALQAHPSVWSGTSQGHSVRAESDPQAAPVVATLRHVANQFSRNRSLSQAAPQTPGAAAQQEALKLLRTRVGQDLEVHLRPGNQTAMQIRGRPLQPSFSASARLRAIGTREPVARSFFAANRTLLRLEDPQSELQLEQQETEANGEQHLRFTQTFHGLPVWPTGLSTHFDAEGNLRSMDGAYVPTPKEVALEPAISFTEAAERTRAAVPKGKMATPKDVTLIIYAPLDRPSRLAWRLTLPVDVAHAWQMVVDALDGRVLSRINQCMDANVVGSGKDLESQNRTLNVWSDGSKFYLADTTKQMFNPAFDPIKDPHGVISIFDARLTTSDALKTVYIVESTNATSWLPDAVSAMVNFADTFDYYVERHNRNSIDGNGGDVQAVVRVAQLDNAFWSGDVKMMFFGNVRPYPVALDVVGHELTHGVTQNSANLVYELQPGALNEAMSDIFGEMVEARINGKPDWQMGEKLGEVFRDMRNPGLIKFGDQPYPSKMSEYVDMANTSNSDHGGVHVNSSIINHAYYLLAEGLPNAVGLRDAEKIFYRALTKHLQKQSQFIDTRLACIASAEELFGTNSVQVQKVGEAFDGVEIFATPPTPEPSPIPVVQGPDSTLFVSFDPFFFEIALGRYEKAKGDPAGGIALVESILQERPAVSGDGSFALFVDSANDLCGVDTDNPNSLQCLGFKGLVHSVAVSPDARLYAFVLRDPVTGQAQNQINIYDLQKDTNRTYKLVVPVQDADPLNSVLYADSMVFTADSKQLIYDAQSTIRFGTGNPVLRWSIFRLDVATATTTVLVPPLEGADFGNPNIGRASNRYLAFDARLTQNGITGILVLDLFTGDVGLVGYAGNILGYPCFTGDESAVIYATPDSSAPNTGASLVRQALSADRLATNGPPSVWLQDATIGVVYRRGTYVSSNAPPTVALTAPANNSTFSAPANITLTAQAADTDGTVAKVEFYQGAVKIGESTTAPFNCTWTAVPKGNYRLLARAFDNLGAATDSDAVNVTVGQGGTAAAFRLSAALAAGAAVRLTIAGPPGSYIIQQSADLKTWADIYPVTIDATGTGTINDSGGPANNRILFYRAYKN